ncbi:hypothetical protein ACFL6I_29015 [candidate division KSB1 bacterium]
MDKLLLKKELIEACRKIQQKTAENLRVVMNEAQQSANDYGAPKDRYDSHRNQLLAKRDMYAQQMDKAVFEIGILDRIDLSREMERVNFGAVVITTDQKIFISIGTGKVNINDEIYFAISPKVPFYEAMKDLKKGDFFEFRGRKIEIKDVF